MVAPCFSQCEYLLFLLISVVQSEIFKLFTTNDINSITRVRDTIRVRVFGCRFRVRIRVRVRIRGRLFGYWVRVWIRIRVRIWRSRVSRWVMVSWFSYGRFAKNSLSQHSTISLGYFVYYSLSSLLLVAHHFNL